MSKVDLYGLLGIRQTASQPEIKAAWRFAAKRSHPDSGGDPDHFIRLTQAYNVLSDPERRATYDATGDFDGHAVDNSHSEMIQLLGSALDQVLGASGDGVEHVDIVVGMKRLIAERLRKSEALRDGTDSKLDALQKVRSRIVRQDEEKNIFLDIIEGKIRHLAEEQRALRSAVRVTSRAVEELEHYSSIVDVIRFVQAGLYRSNPTADQPPSFWITFS